MCGRDPSDSELHHVRLGAIHPQTLNSVSVTQTEQESMFLRWREWNATSLQQVQRQYYRDRTSMAFEDFLIVPYYGGVDGSTCHHTVEISSAQQNELTNLNPVFRCVLQNHITKCLGKEFSQEKHERQDHLLKLTSVEQQHNVPLWPHLKSVSPEELAAYRQRWNFHPYFTTRKYSPISSPCFEAKDFPVLLEEEIARLPSGISAFYYQYASGIPSVAAPVTLPSIESWAKSTLDTWFDVFAKNSYDLLPFSCMDHWTVQEKIAFCASPPVPRMQLLKDSKEPFYLYSSVFQKSVIPPEKNLFAKLPQQQILFGFYLLSKMMLWQCFPNPTASTTRSRRQPALSLLKAAPPPKESKKKKNSKTPKTKPLKDVDKSYFVLTVALDSFLEASKDVLKLESLKDKGFSMFSGAPPSFAKIPSLATTATLVALTYETKFALYRKIAGVQDLPPTYHFFIKSIGNIKKFLTFLSLRCAIPVEVLFQPALAQPCYEGNSLIHVST